MNASPLRQQLTQLLQANRADEALGLCARLCKESPEDVEAWYLQAAMQAQRGRWQDVVRCCEKVISLQPNHTEAHYNLATALGCLGQLSKAQLAYQRVTELDPAYGPAYLGLATCLRSQGHHEEALESLDKALPFQTDDPSIYSARGGVLQTLGQPDKAADSYRRALRLKPTDVVSHYGLGCILHDQGHFKDAQQHLERALELNPELGDAYGRLGVMLMGGERWDDAIRCFQKLLDLQPDHLNALAHCGYAFQLKGDSTEAVTLYRRALKVKPDFQLAQYFLATLRDVSAPQKAPPAYIRDLFDSYADRFDEHLVDKLQYRTPELLNDVVRDALGSARHDLKVLDLGCGTGLVGQLVRGLATTLVGVDLSPKMINKARETNVYDQLHVADIVEYLSATPVRFDLVLAADVFVYIGDLDETFRHCSLALRPGGLFAFSVERQIGDEPYTLQTSGRYAHTSNYIRTLAEQQGLQEIRVFKHILRRDRDKPIEGDLFVFQAGIQRS